MSNQGSYDPPPGNPNQHHLQSNNPWANEQGQQTSQRQQSNTQSHGYDAPPGPPPRRTDTFKETDFIPETERGEQREALEQFEMNKGGESTEDRDVATLQGEFPGVDGSLIAALYGDSKSLSGTREMLQEISTQNQ